MSVFHSLIQLINDIKLKPQIDFQKKIKQNFSNVQVRAKIAMKILKKNWDFGLPYIIGTKKRNIVISTSE